MDSNKIADVLDEAADLYESERYDWCQGQAISYDGLSICASQALAMACGMKIRTRNRCPVDGCTHHVTVYNIQNFFDEDLYHQVRLTTDAALNSSLIMFNDARGVGRTKQDIIDLFKNTAKELRNGQ